MLLKFRPVKGVTTGEYQDSHIHITTYGFAMDHISGHFKSGEFDVINKIVHQLAEAFERLIKANKAMMDGLLDADDDSVYDVKLSNYRAAKAKVIEIIENCPYKVYHESSTMVKVRKNQLYNRKVLESCGEVDLLDLDEIIDHDGNALQGWDGHGTYATSTSTDA